MEQFRDRVKEVEIIVTAVREGATASMINGKQCGSLASVYDMIDGYLKKLVEMDAANDVRLLPLLDEIIRVLERGKVLVLQYGSAQWFELAVTKGDNHKAFKKIHLLLETNMKALQNHISQGSPDSYLSSNLWTDISDAKLRMSAIAKYDHDKILETLQICHEKLPIAIAKLKGTPDMYNLPINMQIDSEEVQIGEFIGKGAYGAVHKAYWLGCEFAVKIIRTRDIDALRKEVGILAKLTHPHIVQLVGFSKGISSSLILMELMDGDLHHLIKDRVKSTSQAPPFPPEVAIDIISQIAAGMAYLHKQGVFHGDLKALNVLFNHRGGHIEAKIADFGVSQIVQLTKRFDTSKHSDGDIASGSFVYSNSSFSGTVGTTGWRAPEVSDIQTKEGETSLMVPTYTAKADVFSFAMTCYEVVSGELPYNSLPRQTINKRIREGLRPILPVDINTKLSSLIQECWETDPQERPTFESICAKLQEIKVPSQTMIGTSQGDSIPALTFSPLGKAFSQNDLTAVHEILVKRGYKDDELSFQVWTKKIQDMRNSRRQGDRAFREKDYKQAIDCYSQFVDVGAFVSPTVFARRSLAYLLNDQAQAALRDARQAQYVHREWPTAYYMQAAALSKLGMEANAKDMLKEGAALDSSRLNSRATPDYSLASLFARFLPMCRLHPFSFLMSIWFSESR